MIQGQGDGGADAPGDGTSALAPEGGGERGAEMAPASDLGTAHEAILGTPAYQFTPSDPPPPPEPSWLDRLFGDLFGAIGRVLGPVLNVVFWIGLAALAALVLWYAGQALLGAWRARRGRQPEEAPAPYVPAAATVRTLLEDARRLASEGRYGEAVRLILRRTIEDVDRQRPGAVRDAMTAREIGRLDVLTEAARVAFGRIAMLVERAAFAGRELSADEYEEARGIYERLTRDLTAGRPA